MSEEPVEPIRPSDFVQSLERGLEVIKAFDADHPELTLAEVARATGLTRAAARRFLLTLVELGYGRLDGRLFSLRPRVLELGFSYLSSLGLPEIAHRHMETLVAQVNESSSLCVFDNDEITYVARVPKRRIMTVALNVGTRLPAYCTSMGRIFLADQTPAWLDEYFERTELRQFTPFTVTDPAELRSLLTQIAEQGFAFVQQQLEVGLRSIAVPIRGADGVVVAALNVSMQVSGDTPEAVQAAFLPHLFEAQQAIEADYIGSRKSSSRRRSSR